jgi:hypothetical protein
MGYNFGFVPFHLDYHHCLEYIQYHYTCFSLHSVSLSTVSDSFLNSSTNNYYGRAAMHKTTLNAEWEGDWTETSFEKDIDKLQKEAEVRLDEKISELTANIANTGEPDN